MNISWFLVYIYKFVDKLKFKNLYSDKFNLFQDVFASPFIIKQKTFLHNTDIKMFNNDIQVKIWWGTKNLHDRVIEFDRTIS